jgi:hypothetical protein
MLEFWTRGVLATGNAALFGSFGAQFCAFRPRRTNRGFWDMESACHGAND